ncbi:MAG: hypothetical protein KDA58_15910 [Planctomycetaceae bacterium]|nr:hypothetical protein [Planctomycetaceae bacterium]
MNLESEQRFVILAHDQPVPHYDLMLQWHGVLWTWRIDTLPTNEHLPCELLGERLADHRLHYLDYEGPVSRGRGTVQRHERGALHWLESGMGKGRVRLIGDKLQGELHWEESSEGTLLRFAPLDVGPCDAVV